LDALRVPTKAWLAACLPEREASDGLFAPGRPVFNPREAEAIEPVAGLIVAIAVVLTAVAPI
jgi:hypothetical protein